MLEALRNAAGSWLAKALLAILVLSFAIWGISGRMLGSFTSNVVITAGETQVSALDYRLAWDRQLSVLSQRLGQRITREQAEALGVDQQVLAQLVAGAVLDEQAREMHLGVSAERLAALIAEDPAFHGPDGKYNREMFDYVLRQVGMRPEDYLRNREQVAVRQQIVEATTDGFAVPDTFLTAVALYRGEDRTVDYVQIPRSLVEPVADPAEDALKTWFEGNKSVFAAPEYRKIVYAKLEPADIADPAAVSDDQVREDYEKNKARYTTPEKRTIQQIVFKDDAAAQKAEETIRGGSTFEDVMKAEGKSETDVSLGTLARTEVADPAVAEAAFALTEGSVSAIVQGVFGPVILRVTKIEPETVKSLDEVKDAIRADLAQAEASRILLDVHDSYEDSRAGGDTIEEAAAKVKLKVVTIDAVSRAGEAPDGSTIKDIPESDKLLAAAFETDTDVENPGLPIGSSGFVFYEVKGVTPARDRTLDEAHDKAVAAWKKEEADRLLSTKAEEARKRLTEGTALDTIATDLGLEKQTKRGLKREADDADFGADGVEAVFAIKPGESGVVTGPNGDSRVLFSVIEAIEPAGAGPDLVPDDAKNSFAAAISDDLLDGLVSRLRGQYDVLVNQTAIDAAKTL